MLGPAGLSPHPLLLPVVTCLSQEASCQGGESQELLILVPEGLTREAGTGEWVWRPGGWAVTVPAGEAFDPHSTPVLVSLLQMKKEWEVEWLTSQSATELGLNLGHLAVAAPGLP